LRSAKVEASKSSLTTTDDAKRAIRSVLVLQVKQAFYTVMLLERSVKVQDQQIEALNEHLRITRSRVESGSATDFDALSTSVRVAQAQNVKIDLERSLDDQRITLRKLLGLPWNASAAVSGTFYQPAGSVPLDTLLERARRDRPDLITAAHVVTMAKSQEAVARGDDDPVLRLHAAYGLNNGYEPNLDVVRGNWAAGVQLEIPVFDGLRTRGKIEESMALERSAEEHLRDLGRNAEAEVRQALQSAVSAEAKIASTDLQVQEAEAAVANARVRYESGAGTNLDLLDAETNVATAHLQQLQARYQYVMAHVALDASSGAFGK
ncbi:MAG: TolC family protein, partial [Bacteroidota bacterium]